MPMKSGRGRQLEIGPDDPGQLTTKPTSQPSTASLTVTLSRSRNRQETFGIPAGPRTMPLVGPGLGERLPALP